MQLEMGFVTPALVVCLLERYPGSIKYFIALRYVGEPYASIQFGDGEVNRTMYCGLLFHRHVNIRE